MQGYLRYQDGKRFFIWDKNAQSLRLSNFFTMKFNINKIGKKPQTGRNIYGLCNQKRVSIRYT